MISIFDNCLTRTAALACGVALMLAGCDSDDDSSKPRGRSSTRGAAANGDTAVVYALMIRDPDGISDYLMAGDAVPSETIDTSKGIELPGGNYYFDDTAVYYSNFESKKLQRYVVKPDLSIELAGEFSLAQYAGGTPVFFSATRAYVIDADDGLLIQFNPSAMEITGEIEVPALLRDGYSGNVSRVNKVGDRILGTVTYWSTDFDKTAEDSTVAIAIDAEADEPLTILRDDRAFGADSSFVADNGDFYAIADGFAGYASLVLGQKIQPSLIRVRRDANEIDSDYLLDLGELLDTKAVNGLWPLTGSKFVLQAWGTTDEEVVTADDLDVVPAWEWFIVDAETRETQKVSKLGRSTTSYSLLRFEVDDELYLQQYVIEDKDYNKAHVELYRLSEDASVEKVVESTRGDVRMMTRLQIAD